MCTVECASNLWMFMFWQTCLIGMNGPYPSTVEGEKDDLIIV